jgi:hypothetical protein
LLAGERILESLDETVVDRRKTPVCASTDSVSRLMDIDHIKPNFRHRRRGALSAKLREWAPPGAVAKFGTARAISRRFDL